MNLPELIGAVTVIAIGGDSDTTHAFNKCIESLDSGSFVRLRALESYEAYNRFVVMELHKHFNTSHCLLIQGDGYIINPAAWNPEFLKYDYIGAPWFDYGPNREIEIRQNGVVGNGGFSLRSKAFCRASAFIGKEILKEIPNFDFSPEDQLLLREYRADIDSICNVAPVEIAEQFSWELHDNDPEYRGQFGFHGKHTLERLKATGVL